jgi:hypothetical protein
MKLSKQSNDYADLKNAIVEMVEQRTYEMIAEHKKSLLNDERVKDINKRFRWDLLWAIPHKIRLEITDRIYKYANDDHVDTALKHIVYELSL